VKVHDCPTVKVAELAETDTDGAAFTITRITFEATVTGTVALSVTFTVKLHLPNSVEAAVVKV